MSDIVQRLRDPDLHDDAALFNEAADRIEALEEALAKAIYVADGVHDDEWGGECGEVDDLRDFIGDEGRRWERDQKKWWDEHTKRRLERERSKLVELSPESQSKVDAVLREHALRLAGKAPQQKVADEGDGGDGPEEKGD